MRVGIVGCGYWGSKHVRVYSIHPDVSKVVAIDSRPQIRQAIVAEYPQVEVRATLGDALDDIDAVVVATPPESHFDVAAEAMTAGKHVLIEKPMATTVGDARKLVQLADETGLTLVAGHTFAYNAAVWKLAELAQSGALGQLHYLDAARLNLGLYREDVNVLWDLAAHDISITSMVMRAVPDVVCAWGTRHTTKFSEDVATLRMLFNEQGVESTIRASWLDPLKVRRTTVVGSEKMAVYNDVDVDERIKVFDRGREQSAQAPTNDPFNIAYRYGDIHSPYVEFLEPLRNEADDFIECSLTGRTPVADGRAGLMVVAVLEASNTSLAENGAPVPIDVNELRSSHSAAV